MSIIILSVEDDGTYRGEPHDIAEELLELNPDAVIRMIRGPISGARVDDRTGVLWLMQRYTASGKPRKGK